MDTLAAGSTAPLAIAAGPGLTAAEVLRLWEAGWRLSPLRRAVLLAAAAVGTSPEEVLRRPVGERDGVLWALRGRLFGTALDAVAGCPGCATLVELSLDQDELLIRMPAVVTEVAVRGNGREHRFRTPTSADVAAVLDQPAENVALELVHRCLIAGDAGAFAADPAPVLRAWEAGDPWADVTLALSCPECDRGWEEALDITSFLWAELDAWSRRTLREVHELARAYGWSESEVLRLSPWRRQCYLGLVTT
jgi:hypothetical protein